MPMSTSVPAPTSAPSPSERRRLGRSDAAISRLGLGTAALGNLYRVVSDVDARATLAAALAAGITYADTAPHYGQGLAERRTGQSISPDVTLSTKVGRVLRPIDPPPPGTERHGFIDGDPFDPVFDYSYDGVMRSFEDSTRRLGRSIDILLAHDLGEVTHGADHPRHLKAFLDGGYVAMSELKAAGRIKAIGLGVNEWQICEQVLGHADLDCVLLAGRYTLLEQTALDSFLPLCQGRNVSVIAAGPFNSGVLAGGAHYNYAAVPPEVADRVKALRAVCDDHAVPLAAAALQFPLAHPTVACVLAGMASPAEVEANSALFNTPIPQALWEDLRDQGLVHPAAAIPALENVTP